MKRTTYITIWTCLVYLLAFGHVSAQSNASKARDRINSIIKQILKRGEFTTNEGYRAVTRIRPSDYEVEEIKGFGDDAIEPLTEHFSSNNAMEYELAMRLMGSLGGVRIIKPLKKIILFDSSARKRKEALRWITQAPWEQGSKIIREAAETDPDEQVREVAKGLLSYRPDN